jgi:integrase
MPRLRRWSFGAGLNRPEGERKPVVERSDHHRNRTDDEPAPAGAAEERRRFPAPLPTRRNRIRDLSILFEHCRRRGYCGSNPLEHIQRPVVTSKRPEIFTVNEAAALLTTAEAHPELEVLPVIAIGLFAGLRMNEIKQLDWRNVDFEHRVIDVDEAIAKTRQQRNVDMVEGLCDPTPRRKGASSPPASVTRWCGCANWLASRNGPTTDCSIPSAPATSRTSKTRT